MKLSQLREFVKQVVREEQDYQQLFKHMLDKVGKSITDMSDDEKKKFFGAVDTAYKAKSEGRLAGYNESVNESAEILKPGTRVKLRGGKTGKVVRYDGKTPGAPFYIVDIGQYYSIEVPADQIKTESVKEAELTAGQKKIDVDGDGEIEGSDLAALRNKK
jgi:preprotein translocase subunit YajC